MLRKTLYRATLALCFIMLAMAIWLWMHRSMELEFNRPGLLSGISPNAPPALYDLQAGQGPQQIRDMD
ncbi:hypothetical protein EUZ85_10115 [Hahella sp. KA22]|uniref:hypothetical protein n=1 Tax=Hahella sp. KA22 TaxID=1628392 RepID=UPI000FDE4C0A|nr:hypothetical protein [Hahella sp. KA22]AZZ91059.1 hypothetical protein ENC22_07560 [Hahella sp. KA22]QAY54429.1 hypothetical protein EUZ85_10115 [Hahella sp. KA22]